MLITYLVLSGPLLTADAVELAVYYSIPGGAMLIIFLVPSGLLLTADAMELAVY